MTGLETASWTFNEFGVGCEGCHGPGAAHAADPENVAPFAEVDDQVGGACLGPAIIPGNAEESLLIKLQREGHPNSLPPQELDWISQWIDAGAPHS